VFFVLREQFCFASDDRDIGHTVTDQQGPDDDDGRHNTTITRDGGDEGRRNGAG